MTLEQLRTKLAEIRATRADQRGILERIFAEEGTTDGAEAQHRRDELAALRAQEIDALERELDPRQFISELDGSVPILLFPLRIQTRFLRTVDEQALLVRVFPDEISVQSHDARLDERERDAGAAFWAAPETKTDPDTKTQREIWRGMAALFGLRRAAWIMRVTDPAMPPPTIGTPLRIPAVWTLPERLILRFYGPGDQILGEILGEPIPDGLEMGFDRTRGDLGFARAGSELEYPPELQWHSDFDAAVKVGMGLRVPLDRIGNPRRIERLVVLGVRLAADANTSQHLIEQLIEDHRYTDGFSILPQGVPTNVTRDGDAPTAPDPDQIFDWLHGDGAFTDNGKDTLYEDECDGLRLARALGIEPDVMRTIEHADRTDGREAIAMKRALWAGTLGYYAQQMLAPLFEDPPRLAGFQQGERLQLAARFYFTNFVFGRGPLPAIRVGDQPYGILPVSGDMLTTVDGRLPPWDEPFVDGFVDALHEKLCALAQAWLAAIPHLARAGGGPGANARLVDVLALQASAVEYHSERLIGRRYLQSYAQFKDGAKGTAAFAEFEQLLQTRFDRFTSAFPSLFATRPEIFNLSFYGGFWTTILAGIGNLNRELAPILTGDVIDALPYSETRAIDSSYPNYIEQIARIDFADVRRGVTRTTADGKTEGVTALLYLLLRHSYLYEYAFAMMRLYVRFKGRPWRAFREKELYNAAYVFDQTYWDYLETEEEWTLPGLAPRRATALALLSSRDQLRTEGASDWKTIFGDVDELQRALWTLAPLSTAQLERLFAEHLDLAGYRLDAWLTGFVYQRLLAFRAWHPNVRRPERAHPLYPAVMDGPLLRYDLNHRPLRYYTRGLYLGAYGWVEGIEPDPLPMAVDDLPAALDPRNGHPVTRDADNFGLIQAPSLNHAVTAALLRSGSVTQSDTPAFNIDLSSARVRDALWLIAGVRNGQAPAALLGYKFERGLRERDVALLQYLPALREAFPMPRPPETDAGPTETLPARDVVNGLRIAQVRREGTLPGLLSFVADAAARAVMLTLADGLIDTFDACSDLMLAESVHQAAQGNYERAAGVVTASGEFMHVPSEFEVVDTPRSGAALTHRVLLAMNDALAAPAVPTPRARLEPQLNAWLDGVIGPLAQLTCGISYLFHDDEGESRVRYVLTMDQLGLEPIDVLYVHDDTGVSELAARLSLLTRARFDSDHAGTPIDSVELELFAPPGAVGTRPLGDVLPLLSQLRSLLAGGRPATQRDFVAPNMLHARTPAAIDAIDETELTTRVLGVAAADPTLRNADSLWMSFDTALQAMPTAGGLDADGVTALLLSAAGFGIPEAVPVVAADAAARLDALKQQAQRVQAIMQTRWDAASEKWTPPSAPTSDTLTTCRDIAAILLGAAFPLMPRIQLTDDVAAAALPASNPAPERVEDWLFLASTVRENAARLQHARVLAAAVVGELPSLQVLQWPTTQKNWVADPPPAGTTFAGDLVSIVLQPAATFDPSQAIAALVIDEWHELIPTAKETTGISFHYDAPNAEPPQALLLAVAQRRLATNLAWSWSELVDCIDQALMLAKMRAVGPDELRHTPLDAVLPATAVAEASTPATIATSFLANVSVEIAAKQVDLLMKT